MVHASKPLTAGKIQSYFRDEYASASNSYFTQGGTLKGHWHGQLAAALDLSADVTPEAFDRLAEGQHPTTGEQLIKHRDTIKTQSGEELGHRAGWDFTFNAPKTVSLTATVGADDRVPERIGLQSGPLSMRSRITSRPASAGIVQQRPPASGLPLRLNTIQHARWMGIQLPISTRT